MESALEATLLAEKVVSPALLTRPLAQPYRYSMEVDMPSERIAKIIFQALEVDVELRNGEVTRTMVVNDTTLSVAFSATEVRLLRSAVYGFVEHLKLTMSTVEAFQ